MLKVLFEIPKMLSDLFGTYDDFKENAYAWLTHQAGHIKLGIIVTYWLAFLTFGINGEYAQKEAIITFMFVTYFAFEILVQGWRGWDTVSDTTFVVLIGSGTVIYAFSEIEPGSRFLMFDPLKALPGSIAATVLLFLGTYRRWRDGKS